MKKLLPRLLFYVALITASAGVAQIAGDVPEPGGSAPEHAPKFPPGVPAAVDNLRIESDDLSTSGYIMFNMPSTTFDGTAQDANERCSYSVEVNGDLVKDNVQYWWCDEVGVSLSAEGHGQAFTVTVWASNEVGDGPKTTVSGYVGEDQARPVTDFTMEITDTSFELKWAPTQGMHGGNYDKNSVKYTLYSYPGGQKVASYGPAVSSASVPISGELLSGDYYFGLEMEYWDVANWTGAVYPMAYSNHEIVNPYEAPFTFDFVKDYASARKMFNIYDANTQADTQTWTLGSTGAVISYDADCAKDDWLFSMPVNLSAGKIYSLKVKASDNGYAERLAVYAGTSCSVEAMTISVISATDVNNSGTAVVLDGDFRVPVDGVYFIGFHACSDANQYNLTISEFAVDVAATLSAPGAVTSLSATPYYFDETPKVRLGFVAPTVTVGGDALTDIDKVVVERDGEVVCERTGVMPGDIFEYMDDCGLGTFVYTVYAVGGGDAGMKTETKVRVSEVYGDNFTYDFSNMTEAAKLFTVINVNNDDQTWTFPSGGPKIEYNHDCVTPHDDWLISMPMVLKGGNIYTFTVNLSNGRGYPEEIALYLGNGTTVESMTDCIVEVTEYDGAKVLTGTYECHTDAIKYLGFHACSPADRNYIQVKKMKVEPTGECDVYNVEHNLAVTGLTIPSGAMAGSTIEVELGVVNKGSKGMGAFTARLYVDDELVDETTGCALPSGSSTTVSMAFESTIFHTSAMIFRAEIEADGDEVADDNVTGDYQVSLNEPTHPRIVDLSANARDWKVALAWSAPDVSGTGYEACTESFEDYPAFSIAMPWSEVENDNIGDWTVVDNDGLKCYRLQSNCNAPNYNTSYCTARAWMVMNPAQSGHTAGYLPCITPATGEQNICCLAGVPEGNVKANDDWLISPMLSGNAHKLTFKAKTWYQSAETFEVLVSKTGKETADFTLLGNPVVLNYANDNYTDFSYDIPAGAKYFAIRYLSADQYGLFIDDISFERAGGDGNTLQIVGYNVYRNGELLNAEPVGGTSYVDSDVEVGVYNYHVNVVYDRGQSALSNMATVEITTTGIDTVTDAVADVKVAVSGNEITVSGAQGRVELFGVDGRLVSASDCETVATFNVASGVYVVRTSSTVRKVAVR